MDGLVDLVDTMIELDVERIKSWYVALTLAGFTQDEAMLKIAQAIHDGLLAS